MTKRMVIPVVNDAGEDAQLAQHFGKAPYFVVVDLDENNTVVSLKTEPNRSEHVGGTGLPHEHLLMLEPDTFVVFGMGPGCLQSLRNFGVTVLQAVGTTVKDILDAQKTGTLQELQGSCPHHNHHH
ncbi:MAG: hypothetical protein NWF04_07040 [Candidatus Bathyarchaeota archaeon]|nr:hypothetical protein [Candidatus Bathyarchaeota archaeon]